jgi:hypothetical protein
MGNLYMLLNPNRLTNDLTMELDYFDSADAALWLDLTDTNALPVATNLVGNVLQGSNAATRAWIDLPLLSYSNAAGLRLRRGWGEVAVYATRLYPVGTEVLATEASPAENGGRVVRESPAAGGGAGPANADTASAEAAGGGNPLGGMTNRAGGSASTTTNVPALLVRRRVIYVNGATGNDACAGLSPAPVTRAGGEMTDAPKRTIRGGLAAARAGDRVVIQGGPRYGEDLNIAGRDIDVTIAGHVDLSGTMPVESAAVLVVIAPTNAVGVGTNAAGLGW